VQFPLRLLARGSREQPRKIDPYTVPMRKRETVGSEVTLWWVMSKLHSQQRGIATRVLQRQSNEGSDTPMGLLCANRNR